MADEQGLPEVPLAVGTIRLAFDDSQIESELEKLGTRVEDQVRRAIDRAFAGLSERLAAMESSGRAGDTPAIGQGGLVRGPESAPSEAGSQIQPTPVSEPPVFDEELRSIVRQILERTYPIESQIINAVEAVESLQDREPL
jgi:hypothetical protein